MSQLERILLRLSTDLRQMNVSWAVVGGLAVSIRARPRTTFDVDIVVSVAADNEAEDLVRDLRQRGFALDRTLEQEATGRLAGARLVPPDELGASASIDLLFASSGIEDEIAAQAEELEVLRRVRLPVARVGHLIALKVLADQPNRPQDRSDALALLAVASPSERALARASVERIERRGYHRGKNLLHVLRQLIQQVETENNQGH